MNASTTDLLTLPWVPVTRAGARHLVTLPEVLFDGSSFDDLADDLLPVEREGMLRFLESLVGYVVRGATEDEFEHVIESRTLPEQTVSRFLTTYGDRFDLLDPRRPFLQEWDVSATQRSDPSVEKNVKDLHTLHVQVPGASSSQWGLRHEKRDATDPAVLAVLLVVTWFHTKPSNAGAPSFYLGKCIAGAPSGGPLDTSFHVLGANLMDTILRNIPTRWTDEHDDQTPPAWLCQDYQPTPRDLSSAVTPNLWCATWTPNRPLLIQSPDGELAGFVNGMSQRVKDIQILGDPKSAAKAVHGEDYAHAWVGDAGSTKDPRRSVKAPARLTSTQGAHTWYTQDLDASLRQWIGSQPRVIATESIKLLGFHNEKGDTYGNRTMSEWLVVRGDDYTLTGEARQAATALLMWAMQVRKLMAAPLLRASDQKVDPRRSSALLAETQREFLALADLVVIPALRAAADGTLDLLATSKELNTIGTRVFDHRVDELSTSATEYRIAEAKSRFVNRINTEWQKAFDTYRMEQPA